MRFFPAFYSLPALVVFAVLPGYGQAVKLDPRYTGESAVIVRAESHSVMQADGTGYRDRLMVVQIQSEAALRELGVLTIPFASASEKVEIQYARSRHPDGTVTESKVADAIEQPNEVTVQAPFYSDLKTAQLPIRSLRVGDTLEWKARIVRTKAEAANQFWGEDTFTDGLVTLAEISELRYPKTLAVTVWTNPRSGVKPIETSTETEKVYRWEHSHLTPTAGKDADAEKARKKKAVLTADEEADNTFGAYPSFAWTTFPSWQAVGEWYRLLEAGRTVPDADVKAKVAELTAGKVTEEAKVRAVYAYVSGQVRYIGVAFGVGRYQPHPAGDVLANQYGDCKDKHTLLAAMLTQLGLKPDAVLIGAQIRFNEAVPSPAAFNHLITHVEVAGKPVWLDTTAEVAPYRVLLAPLRDRQALVVPESGAARIERTPADLPFASTQTFKAVGTLDKDGTSQSRISIAVRGDSEVFLRAVLRQVPPANYGELIQKLSEGMGYGGTATNPAFTSVADTTEPLSWSYDYKREKGGDWDNHRIIPQTSYNSLPQVDEKEPPVATIDLNTPRTETSSAELKLPSGWGAELPEAIHAKSAYATLDETFRFANGTLYTDLTVVVLQQKVPQKEWKIYQKWCKEAKLNEQVYVQLTHTGTSQAKSGADTGGASSGGDANEAARLIRAATTAMKENNFDLAQSLLDQAKEKNPHERSLWGEYGNLAARQMKYADALTAYQKELEITPDAFWIYPNLVRVQSLLGRRPDMIATLRTWVAADPMNDRPVSQLLSVLIYDGKADEAVKVADAAIPRMPANAADNDVLQLQYGRALLKSGDTAKGVEVLTKVVQTTALPGPMNDAAYYLVESNQALPFAEATSRKAVQMMAEESQSWTLDEKIETLRSKSSLICAGWDTLGWILFREGKPQDGLDYVQASWANRASAEVGEHLGDLRAALGQPELALISYEQTLTLLPSAARATPGDTARAKSLEDKIAKLKLGGAKVSAVPSLEDRRKVQLGGANGRNGVAEYRLLLSATKVERLEPATDKTLKDADKLVQPQKLPVFFPRGSTARLVKLGILNCHSNTCELIFEP